MIRAVNLKAYQRVFIRLILHVHILDIGQAYKWWVMSILRRRAFDVKLRNLNSHFSPTLVDIKGRGWHCPCHCIISILIDEIRSFVFTMPAGNKIILNLQKLSMYGGKLEVKSFLLQRLTTLCALHKRT